MTNPHHPQSLRLVQMKQLLQKLFESAAGHSRWIGPPPSQAIPGQTSSFTPLLSDGLIPHLIFSSPKRHNCWTFLAEIFFSELLRVWAGAGAALGGRGTGAQPQRVLQPLQHRLQLLRLHQGEREGMSKPFRI